jgi:hypothetical protein
MRKIKLSSDTGALYHFWPQNTHKTAARLSDVTQALKSGRNLFVGWIYPQMSSRTVNVQSLGSTCSEQLWSRHSRYEFSTVPLFQYSSYTNKCKTDLSPQRKTQTRVFAVWVMGEGVCGTKTVEVTEIWRKWLHFIHNLYSSEKFFPHGATAPSGPRPPHCQGFTITLRHITLNRTLLDEWSACRRDLYLTTHKTSTRETRMPTVGLKPEILASQRPQTHDLDRAATWQNIRKNNSRVIGVGHVARVAEMGNTLKGLVRKSKGIRPVGRSRRRWTMTLK